MFEMLFVYLCLCKTCLLSNLLYEFLKGVFDDRANDDL